MSLYRSILRSSQLASPLLRLPFVPARLYYATHQHSHQNSRPPVQQKPFELRNSPNVSYDNRIAAAVAAGDKSTALNLYREMLVAGHRPSAATFGLDFDKEQAHGVCSQTSLLRISFRYDQFDHQP